jgi:hypothetical protein
MHLALLGAASAAVLAAVAVAALLRSAPGPEASAEDEEVPDTADARERSAQEQPSYL